MSELPPAGANAAHAPYELLRRTLLTWYRQSRRDLPWRRTRDAYAIWVSETMLQQTRVETVIPYWERFVRELPTVQSLAEAPEERVLGLWSGLGYYRRARMLHAAARRVVQEHGGTIPRELEQLRALEGVGAYTAGAIASIAFDEPAPLVDGNVARVLARLFAIREDVKSARGSALLWELAERLVRGLAQHDTPGAWNQALMELGATVCSPRAPACEVCPARELCAARARGIVAELPRVTPKRSPTAVQRVVVVLSSRGAVLLALRRRDALFGGLWEPPGGERGLEPLAEALGVSVAALEPAGEVVHVLSHRRLHVKVMTGRLHPAAAARATWSLPGPEYDAIEAVPLARLGSIAHSTLARKILAVANVPARRLRSKARVND
jgi:A/G-specific adenine glycosylase